MVNELAEPSCPQWVEAAGLTTPPQQWRTRSLIAYRGGLYSLGGSPLSSPVCCAYTVPESYPTQVALALRTPANNNQPVE